MTALVGRRRARAALLAVTLARVFLWVFAPVFAWAALLAIAAPAAHGEPARRVVVVVAGASGDSAAELLARTRGELSAAHFDVDTTFVAPDSARRATVEREARRDGVAAALGIFLDGAGAEIWVSGGAPGRTTVQALPAGTGASDRRAAVLAAKAVDLLRATLADLPAPPAPQPARQPAPPAPAAQPAGPPPAPGISPPPAVVTELRPPPPPEPERRRLTIDAGLGWLRAGAAGSIAPYVALAARGRVVAARIAASGLGSSADAAAPAGTARLGQALLLGEALLCAHPARAARICAGAGGGAYLLSVDGRAAAGFEGNRVRVWSAVGAAGAGAAIDLGARLSATLDLRALGAWPATVVRVDGQSVARAGGVGLWLAAGLGVRL